MRLVEGGAGLPGRPSKAALLGAGGGLFATTVMWGTIVPFVAALLTYFDAYMISMLRYGLALPFLLILVYLVDGPAYARPSRTTWLRIFYLGGGMAGFSTFYTLGVRFSDPLTAAVVLTANPVVGALVTKAMYRTPLEPGLIPAIALAVCGGLIFVWGGPRAEEGMAIGLKGGEVLLLLGVSCWSWYTLKSQEWLSGMTKLRVTLTTSTMSTVWLAAIFLFMWVLGEAWVPTEAPTVSVAMMLFCLSWGAAGLAIVFWHNGAYHFGFPAASITLNLVPVFSFVISALIFDLTPTAFQIVGGLIVLSGVVQIQYRKLRGAGS